jgi:hypothetical protein
VQQGFAVAAAEVCKGRQIPIVRVNSGINMLVLRRALAVLHAGSRARPRVKTSYGSMGCRVFLVEQRLQGNRNARYGYCRATNAAKESAPRYQTLAFTPFLGASSAPLHLLTFHGRAPHCEAFNPVRQERGNQSTAGSRKMETCCGFKRESSKLFLISAA